MKLLFGLAIVGLTFTACSDDDDDDTQPASTNNTGGGGGGGGGGNTVIADSLFTTIATDPTGDASVVFTGPNPSDTTAGLDATEISFRYDSLNDDLVFRIKVADMSVAASNPSFDLSFRLPNGNDDNKARAMAPGNPANVSIMTDKTATFYAAPGGTPPSSYTFGSFPSGISYTTDAGSNNICAGCLNTSVNTSDNWITITIDRKNVITDTEFAAGSDMATIKILVNTGNEQQNADTIGDGTGDDFTFTK